MTDFRELKAPVETYHYGGWYVSAEWKCCEPSTWLATTGEVTSSQDNMSILFFDTQLDALEESFKYYQKHGRVYPHASMTATIGFIDDGGSQVMEFI